MTEPSPVELPDLNNWSYQSLLRERYQHAKLVRTDARRRLSRARQELNRIYTEHKHADQMHDLAEQDCNHLRALILETSRHATT